jgi:hypothetical protein
VCRVAIDDDIWESGDRRDPPKEDYDSARETLVTRLVEVPIERLDELDDGALDGVCNNLPALPIPDAFAGEHSEAGQ